MNHPRPARREMLVRPRPDDPSLTVEVAGIDHQGARTASRVIVEKPLTLFLNSREVVTMMTIGDHPQLLAVGYLANQNMLKPGDVVDAVEFDEDLGVVVVRTPVKTDFEQKLARKVRTSGCAQGTIFGDVIDAFARIRLPGEPRIRTSWLYALTKRINTEPSLYLAAGAVHGCVLCEEDRPLVFMEDVGRHNAVDKVAGWMFMNKEPAANKIFYTTGRLTSEMVIKTAMMGIPILVSRSGFTAWGVELARQVGMTLIGRARGKRFLALSGAERIVFDADAASDADEDARHRRKGASGDD
jgi:FdhD protein